MMPLWLAVSGPPPLPSPSPVPTPAGLAPDPVVHLACCGSLLVIILGLVVLNIAMLVWVARDAKARGLDGSVIWMLVVFFTSVIGLVIYLLARPQGLLMRCASCGNRRLAASRTCPHCGHP